CATIEEFLSSRADPSRLLLAEETQAGMPVPLSRRRGFHMDLKRLRRDPLLRQLVKKAHLHRQVGVLRRLAERTGQHKRVVAEEVVPTLPGLLQVEFPMSHLLAALCIEIKRVHGE